MATTARKPKRLSDEDLARVLELAKQSRQRRAEADRARVRSAESGGGAGAGSSRGADSPGVLLRHARSRAERRGRGRAGAEDPGEGRGLGRQAAPGRSRRAAGEPPQVSQPRRRGRRDARRLRVLGDVEGQDRRPRREAEPLRGIIRFASSSRRSSERSSRTTPSPVSSWTSSPCSGRSSFSS